MARALDFKKALEEVKKADRKGRPLLSYIQFARNRFEAKREDFLEAEADRFLRSNLPLSFYNKFVVLDSTYYDFVKTLEDIVRFHEFYASASRNFQMYEKHIAKMKRVISPILDQMDKCFFSYSRLKKYVLIWNVKDYEEIFNPKFLDINNLDFSEFQNCHTEYSTRLRETKKTLLNYRQDILQRRLNAEESTTRMFSKLAMLPSSSLKLER